MSLGGGPMPITGPMTTQAAAPLATAASAVPLPPVSPTATPNMTPVPQQPSGMASALQNIAPGLSQRLNDGKPVDPSAPYGHDIFGHARTQQSMADRRSAINAALGGMMGGGGGGSIPMPSGGGLGAGAGGGSQLAEMIRQMIAQSGGGPIDPFGGGH